MSISENKLKGITFTNKNVEVIVNSFIEGKITLEEALESLIKILDEEEKESSEKIKFGVFIDLDGTSLDRDFNTLNKELCMLIILLRIERKDILIFIITGKKFSSALAYHNQLRLNSFLASYSGAHVIKPNSEQPAKMAFTISNYVVRMLLNEKEVVDNCLEILVDTNRNELTLCTSDHIHWMNVYIDNTHWKKMENLSEVVKEIGEDDCFQIVIEIKNDKDIVNKFMKMIRTKYRNSLFCDITEKLKPDLGGVDLIPDKRTTTMRIRSLTADKLYAAHHICSYYNLNIKEQVVFFGDGENDARLMPAVWRGIAMKNSKDLVKCQASDITELSNHDAGVAHYLNNNIFNLGWERILDAVKEYKENEKKQEDSL